MRIMKTKTYTKKLLIDNEFSTPEARAERLKRVRNLSNLSRKEICESSGININTYKGWELARFGGLPVDGAEKIVRKVAEAGVICSIEWLLYGKSPSPSLAIDLVSFEMEAASGSIPTKLNLIEKEFSVYQDVYKNAVLIKVEDDSVLPNFKNGDFLAGIKRYDEEIELTIDQLCIAQTIDGRRLIRYVKKSNTEGLYSLIGSNPLSKSSDIVVLNIKLLYTAPISRHYIVNNIS